MFKKERGHKEEREKGIPFRSRTKGGETPIQLRPNVGKGLRFWGQQRKTGRLVGTTEGRSTHPEGKARHSMDKKRVNRPQGEKRTKA